MYPSEKALGLHVWGGGRRRTRRSNRAAEEPQVGAAAVSMLPTDVLLLVFARLTAVDLVRAGAVCVSWRKALKAKGRLPPRTIFPWLIPRWATDGHCAFLDTNARKTYRIHLPNEKRMIGKSDDGFLVYEDFASKRLSMINPITGATVSFPPLPAPLQRCACVLVVSTGSGYTMVVERDRGLSSFFADAGNLETWGRVSSILEGVAIGGIHARGMKLCGLFRPPGMNEEYYQFFTCDLNDTTDLKVWAFKIHMFPCWCPADFGRSFPDRGRDECVRNCFEPEDPWVADHYPVALPNGDLIVVCRADVDHVVPVKVMVYKMPADLHGEAEIVPNIGNYAIFLDDYSPYGSIVLSTVESPELKPSTIYFNDQHYLAGEDGLGWNLVKRLVSFYVEARLFPMHRSWFVPVF